MAYRHIFVILVFISILFSRSDAALSRRCRGKPTELVLILDESRSIYPPDFEKQKKFVHDFVETYEISSTKVRVGVISFSDRTFKRWDLSTHTNKQSLLDAVDALPNAKGGKTYTHEGLKMARKMFLEMGRKGIDWRAVLITDGQSSEQQKTIEEATKLQEAGVDVFAIGVGKKVNVEELNHIASDPDKTHVFITAFDKMDENLKNALIASTCELLGNPVGECTVDIQTDLAFVLGSINQNPSGAKEAMGFVKQIVNDDNMMIGPDMLQVALVPDDCTSIGFKFNAYQDKPGVTGHLDFASTAFEETSDLISTMRGFYEPANGGREDANKVAVILMDRASPDKAATIQAAKAAKERGITVVAVGVGNQVDNDELSQIASDPSLKFNVADYNALWDQRKEIVWNLACP